MAELFQGLIVGSNPTPAHDNNKSNKLKIKEEEDGRSIALSHSNLTDAGAMTDSAVKLSIDWMELHLHLATYAF